MVVDGYKYFKLDIYVLEIFFIVVGFVVIVLD